MTTWTRETTTDVQHRDLVPVSGQPSFADIAKHGGIDGPTSITAYSTGSVLSGVQLPNCPVGEVAGFNHDGTLACTQTVTDAERNHWNVMELCAFVEIALLLIIAVSIFHRVVYEGYKR